MNFQESVERLSSYIPAKSKRKPLSWGLRKIAALLQLAGNPHKGLKYVHVGGTAGKGSTATIMSSILQASGYKTGLHVSPHTVSIRERAQINGVEIPEERFAEIFTDLEPHLETVKKEFGVFPSYFEILLVIAFIYFKQEHVDIAVLEVGLGGMLDGTNIIDCNYQIITNVGLDHTAILGNTKEEILRDKQEIIKQNSIVVTGIQEPELQKIIKEKAQATNSKISIQNTDFFYENVVLGDKTSFDFVYSTLRLPLRLGLAGLFQASNASLAVAMALQIQKEFSSITHASIKIGVSNANILGRMQVLQKEPLIILDGAHNPDKIRALTHSITQQYPGRRFITVFRYKKRDDIMQSLKSIRGISDYIIITGSTSSGDMGVDPIYDETDIEKKSNRYILNMEF
jgi:dihydrofolate synthase/folylpolyglutamate synthase